MKYYLIEVSEGDSKIQGKAMYEYATLHEAETNFHKKLGIGMASNLYTSQLCMVVNSEGGTYPSLVKKWSREVALAEEVVEELTETENEVE